MRLIPTLLTALLSATTFLSATTVRGAETGRLPLSSDVRSSAALLAEEIAGQCGTGSLIFSRGDCLAVRVYTQSPYTHVGMVVFNQGEPLVYDSMNGVGVRRLTLEEYLETQSPDVLHLYHPRRELTVEESSELEQYLESQLGRPYSVKHHVTGKRNAGIHCSEYVTDALMSINRLQAENPPRVSPASLAAGITAHGVYTEGEAIPLPRSAAPAGESSSWCARLWEETKACTLRSCRKMSRWFLCR